MGKLVRLIGSGIGLASEALAARKEGKAAASAAQSSAAGSRSPPAPEYIGSDSPPQYAEVSDQDAKTLIANHEAVAVDSKEEHFLRERLDNGDQDELAEDDDELWGLDDAAGPHSSDDEDAASPRGKTKNIDSFLARYPVPQASAASSSPLPCPVIIPQRRPRDKQRGFVRAYAPVLEDCGIDQAAFLDFLQVFHQSSKEDPWLQVVNVAAGVAGFVPSAIATGVSIGVQITAGVAMEVQRRKRANDFLDRINKEFFIPRGLYSLIITYKPDSTAAHESINITQAISKSVSSVSESTSKSFRQKLRLSSGTTYGQLELPQAAPLVFPALDSVAADDSAEGVEKQNKLKSSQKFVSAYYDRRAQVLFEAENPGSPLAVSTSGEKQFASRFSDPNHPANSGSLISLLSGGNVDLRGRHRGFIRQALTGKKKKDKKRRLRKMLQKDVVYLMIANMPSEQELQVAAETLSRNKQ